MTRSISYDPVSQQNHLRKAIGLYVTAMVILSLLLVILLAPILKASAAEEKETTPGTAEETLPVPAEEAAEEVFAEGKEPGEEGIEEGIHTGYAYTQLTPEEKEVYLAVSEAVEEMDDLENYCCSADADAVSRAIFAVFIDRPDLYWFGGAYSNSYYTDENGNCFNIYFDYLLSEEQVESSRETIESKCKAIADSLRGLSDYETAKGLYEYLVENTVYDADYDLGGDSLYYVVTEGRGVCHGYARTAQYVFTLLGMECTYPCNGTHAWNIVKLDGSYYHYDATWGDDDDTDPTDDPPVFYAFLNFDDDIAGAIEDHFYTDEIPWPECTASEASYYVREGLLIDGFDAAQLTELIRTAYDEGGIELRFADHNAYQKAFDWMIDRGGINDALSDQSGIRYTYIYKDEMDVFKLWFG